MADSKEEPASQLHSTNLPFPFSLALPNLTFPAADSTTTTTTASRPQPAQPPLELIAQGAESRLYRTEFLYSHSTQPVPYLSDSSRARPVANNRPSSSLPPSNTTTSDSPSSPPATSTTTPTAGSPLPAALKYRPPKPWRHPTLDARLTRQRLLAEARALVRARRAGAAVPGVLGVDPALGVLVLEWIWGESVKAALHSVLGRFGAAQKEAGSTAPAAGVGTEGEVGERLGRLMERIGACVGRLHAVGIIHGDLTTSNLMLRPQGEEEGALEGEVVIIDFGLASQSDHPEDKAVDLYVLERAFASTHPAAEELFKGVLEAYGKSYKGGKPVLKKLEDVRQRGRKKSMIG
jgi:TP53 regulating kinase and related kinases